MQSTLLSCSLSKADAAFSAGAGEAISFSLDENGINVTSAASQEENSEQAFLDSKTFVDIMRVIGGKNTDDFENNTADIEPLWDAAYSIYKDGVIDLSYNGVEAACAELFKSGGAHEFFSKKRASDISAALTQMLSVAFLETAGYKTNVAACLFIKNLIKESEDFIDKKDDEIVFISSLAKDRLEFLAINTQQYSAAVSEIVSEFSSAVNSFDKNSVSGVENSFGSLRSLYLCCELDGISDEVNSKYSEISAFYKACSYSTYVFLNTVPMIEGKDETTRYELLSACYLCYGYLDTAKAGVEDAINKYEEQKSSYEATVNSRSEELAEAQKHVEQNVNAKMVFFDMSLRMIVWIKNR